MTFGEITVNIRGEAGLLDRSGVRAVGRLVIWDAALIIFKQLQVFQRCYEAAKRYILQKHVHRPTSMKSHRFLGVSGFYYQALGANIARRQVCILIGSLVID